MRETVIDRLEQVVAELVEIDAHELPDSVKLEWTQRALRAQRIAAGVRLVRALRNVPPRQPVGPDWLAPPDGAFATHQTGSHSHYAEAPVLTEADEQFDHLAATLERDEDGDLVFTAWIDRDEAGPTVTIRAGNRAMARTTDRCVADAVQRDRGRGAVSVDAGLNIANRTICFWIPSTINHPGMKAVTDDAGEGPGEGPGNTAR